MKVMVPVTASKAALPCSVRPLMASSRVAARPAFSSVLPKQQIVDLRSVRVYAAESAGTTTG